MSDEEFRQWPTAESKGIDKGYKEVRPEALRELQAQMAGPQDPRACTGDAGIKNPDRELEHPAPFVGSGTDSHNGPNGAGNSSGQGEIDPQGQQGGTVGGPPAKPSVRNEVHPLADDRATPSLTRICHR